MKPLCLVLALVTGCSFVFTKGPPDRPQTYPDCSSSFAWPIVDGVFSLIFLASMASSIADDSDTMVGNEDDNATRGQKITSAALLAALTGVGAYVGYRRVDRCRRVRDNFDVQHQYGSQYGYPYAPQPYPPPYQPPQPQPQPQPQPLPPPPPPSSGLGTEGDVCAASAECATGLTCQQNVCIRPPAAK